MKEDCGRLIEYEKMHKAQLAATINYTPAFVKGYRIFSKRTGMCIGLLSLDRKIEWFIDKSTLEEVEES